jgi:hypothetical protein
VALERGAARFFLYVNGTYALRKHAHLTVLPYEIGMTPQFVRSKS